MMFDWAYSGANKAVPRNVGPECAYYLSFQRQIIETLVVTAISVYILVITYPKLCVPHEGTYLRSDRGGKRLLLIVFTLLWGMEIGFKFASRTVIYLLNPCHVTTLIQIYLLSAPPSKTVTTIFRIHLNLLNGPLLAFLFPETASRKIFAEAALYWIQHGMMFVIPYYLLRIGGVYNVEPLWDFNWAIFSYCLNLMYHFIILQPIAIPAQVNLNHMLCPAILDPFEGPWYRFAAVIHQALLCPLLCKLYCLLAEFCLTKFPPTKVKPQMKDHLTDDTSLIVEGFIRRKSRGSRPLPASVMLAIRMPRHGSGARVVLRSMDLYAEVSDSCKQRDPGCVALSQQLGCDCQDQKVTVTGD